MNSKTRLVKLKKKEKESRYMSLTMYHCYSLLLERDYGNGCKNLKLVTFMISDNATCGMILLL